MLPILAIETTGELCSTALLITEKSYVEKNIKMKHIHSEKLILMIEDVLREGNIAASELQAVAVSMGPGSFTGLRIGMASAKGIALGADLPIIPVPTFGALAYQINSYLSANVIFNIINKVNIDEVYFAKYISGNKNAEQKSSLTLALKSEVDNLIDENELVFGDYIKDGKTISSPNAVMIAKWALLFGKDVSTKEYDFLEPTYLKNFVAKVKK